MRAGLRKLLLAENTVKTIVDDRIFITRIPQGRVKECRSKDHIVITQIDSEENKSLDGTSELRFLDFDIDCKALTSDRADILAKAVRTYLKDYTGAAGDETIGAVLFEDETDSFETGQDDSDKGYYVTTLDFQVQYNPV